LTKNFTLISVALSVEPPLLHDVLRELLASEPDIELINFISPDEAQVSSAKTTQPDVVILSSSNPEDESLSIRLLFASPRSRVLALTTDGRCCFLYELRPHRIFLGELSRDALLAAVRGAMGAEHE
jgi:DNA-binding NarL/FixJ family response regulator